jgi:hypothetical protein
MSSISAFSLSRVMIPSNAAALHNPITLGATTDYASSYGESSTCSIK